MAPRRANPSGVPALTEARRALSSARGFLLLPLELLAMAAIGWLWSSEPDATTTAWQWPGQRLLYRGSSPYGRLLVTEAGGQTNIIENGVLLASIPNVEQAEETVHFAMAQRPAAARVWLVGGVLGGVPEEILRYPVAEVHSVELDPLVLSLGRELLRPGSSFGGAAMPSDHDPRGEGRFTGSGDARWKTFASDPRAFLRETDAPYDVVMLALPDPSTAQLNRLFTHECFGELRNRMAPDGVVSFAVGRYENYASPELERLLSCARQTVAGVFQNVLLIPGGRVQFLASDGPLTTNIAPALEQAGVSTRWVNRHYLAATVTPDRLAGVERAASASAPVNRDLAPALYYLHLRYWASQFEAGYGWLACGLALAAGVAVWRLRGAGGVIFASGFAGASLEVVLLLGLQVLVGSLYQQVALVVTLFMAGLAAGAWGAMRWLARVRLVTQTGSPVGSDAFLPRGGSRPKAGLLLLAVLVAAFALALPLALVVLGPLARGRFGAVATEWTLGLLTFAFAVVVGAQFPLANRFEAGTRSPAIRLYTADFLGASGGALLTSTLLVPVIGVSGVCLVVAGLNALAGLVLWRTQGTS